MHRRHATHGPRHREVVNIERLEGKIALITGSSTGIGQAIAVRFAREGAHVALNHRPLDDEPDSGRAKVEEAQKAVLAAGSRCMLLEVDVSKEDQVVKMFEEVLGEFGDLHILVNNAGIQRCGPSHETTMMDFDRVIAVNLRGAYLCARRAIQHFLSRPGGGVIINNSSVHQTIPRPRYLSYAISKAGMANFTKTLALEYACRGIRINAIGPGVIDTPLKREAFTDPAVWSELKDRIPMGRPGTPEEIAAVVAFLASDDASYITGQTIYACGGFSLHPDFTTPISSGE
jgi:glucose 1-dehydrogenase